MIVVRYLELVYRWSIFFKKEALCEILNMVYLSQKLMNCQVLYVTHQNCHYLNLICSKNVHDLIENQATLQYLAQCSFQCVEGLSSATNNFSVNNQMALEAS